MVPDPSLLNQVLSAMAMRLKSKLIKRINMDNERQLVSKRSRAEKCETPKLVAKTHPSTF